MVQTPQNPSVGPPVESAVVESDIVFSGVGVICEICEDRDSGAGGGGGGVGRSWDCLYASKSLTSIPTSQSNISSCSSTPCESESPISHLAGLLAQLRPYTTLPDSMPHAIVVNLGGGADTGLGRKSAGGFLYLL